VNRSFAAGQTTWSNYRDGQSWSKPGGDLGSSFGTTTVGNAAGSAYKFDLTRLVQTAVNGQFGTSRYTRVALIDTGGDSSGSYKEFHSTRSASTSLRPRLVITYQTGSATQSSTAASSSTGTTLRVMQWNIHKTTGSDGRCDPDRIASRIKDQSVQVVSLNEVNFFSGECAYTFDMGAKLQSLLQQKTGATWYRQNVNAGGVGNVLLSRYRPVSSGSHLLSNGRGVAQMTIVVNGRNVNLFSIHVEYYTASWRPAQISQGVSYMSNFSEPRIMMGDFNTSPGTSDYYIIAKVYGDAWATAKSAGTAWAYNGTGATHGTSRFDYAFYSKTSVLSLQNVKVPDMRTASDHDPVISTFTVK
jgi:endonuclease/exonuclease/phosphatase family metal-dependent hydrolase